MANITSYIEVAVSLPVYDTYTYGVSEQISSFASTGKRTLVPFGRRRITGYILGECTNICRTEIKPVLEVLDEIPLFSASMVPFFRWIADYYLHPVGEVIKGALPGGLNLNDYSSFVITEKGKEALKGTSITPLEKEILGNLFAETHGLKDLSKKLNRKIPKTLIRTMKSRELINEKIALKGGKTKPKMDRYVSLLSPNTRIPGLSDSKKKIMDALKNQDETSVKQLKELVPTAPRLIKSLADAGHIAIFKKKAYRDPFGDFVKPDKAPVLTREQEILNSTVKSSFGKGFATYLLSGVTGSGKTEVYLQLAAEAVDRGYSVLVLVPEIVLISQMERRFRARFGECVAVLHSGLSTGERYDQWLRIINEEASIVIGARSAVFAPLNNIGLIIVDEEHDTSYKQDGGLRYNARDLAVFRAKLHGGIALLGSATPSIQSYYNVKTKKFVEVKLTKRVEKRALPKITVVDLRKNRDVRGIRRFITSELYDAMKETLGRGEQVLLFLNRRGFATMPVCASCGAAMRCKNCDITLTLHQKHHAYKCHYCGFTVASATSCLTCGSPSIKLLGLGTEKVEDSVQALFPEARVARMDRDTTTRKGSILKILKGLRNQTIDILVGTQMVAKGHDFPNITLVGVLCADLSLNFPDFRSGERTFQILAQVAGRAGRGDVPGRVVMQTYNPNHFSLLAAKDQDFRTFYNKEITFRKTLNYPPFSRMVQLKISGKDKEKTRQHAIVVGDFCHAIQKTDNAFLRSVEVLGPIEASLPKIAQQYRWQILLKAPGVTLLHQFVHRLLFENRLVLKNKNVKVIVDVDPFFMM